MPDAARPAAAYPALEARLRALHPYEQADIIAVPVVAGSPGYLAWVAAATAAGSAGS